jgi:Tol biopolymer transport system component
MSPEQVQGKPLDHRSDVFALGILLYEMATGERPFAGDTFADVASSILKDTPASVTERKADLPRDLAKLVKHCLEKEPRKRFQSTLDLANELEELRREVDSGEAFTSGGAPVVTSRAGGKRRVWLVGGAVVAALALGAASLMLNRTAAPPAAPLEITPFTGDGGVKMNPKLSPDGEKVAYAWAGSGDDNWDIYVKALGVGTKPLRLTEHPASDRFPTWSPDGRQIAFVREFDEGAALYSVPWLGGHEARLADVIGPLTLSNFYPLPVPSWSADGESLAYAETSSEREPARIVRLSLDTLEKQPLSSPAPGTLGDLYPSFSPDGRRLAFVRSGSSGWGDLDVWVQPAEGGEARRVTFGKYETLDSLSWTADGGEIIFAVGEGWGKIRIRQVALAGGEPRPVPGIGEGAAMASIVGSRMVFAQRSPWPPDVWRVPGRGSALSRRQAEKLISSSGADASAVYSPDGRRIAFTSTRSGTANIWVCDNDGANPVQLTSFEAHTGSPDWSPDGQRIAFDSMEAGDWNLYVIDAQGGRSRRLTKESSSDNIPTWSRDGHSIYFTSNRGGDQQIWRIPVAGGQADQVTRGGGYRAMPSWNGKHLYYANRNTATGIWRVPLQGGTETEVLLGPIALSSAWAVSQSGLYYATSRGLPPGLEPAKSGRAEYVIHHLDFESGQVTDVFRKEGPFNQMGLAVSPDEEWILYSEGPLQRTSELMLVENFR